MTPITMTVTDRVRDALIRHGDLDWSDANRCVEELQDGGLLAPDPPRCGDPAPDDAGLGPHAVTCLKPAGHEYDAVDPNASLHEASHGWRWPSSSGRTADGLPKVTADILTEPLAELSGVPDEYVRRALRALLSIRGAFSPSTGPESTHVTVHRRVQYGVELDYSPPSTPGVKTRFVELEDERRAAEHLAESPRRWDPPGRPGVVYARTITTVTGAWTQARPAVPPKGVAA